MGTTVLFLALAALAAFALGGAQVLRAEGDGGSGSGSGDSGSYGVDIEDDLPF